MKQTFIFFVLAVFLFSCKKDEDTTPANLILGKWSLNKNVYWLTTGTIVRKDTIAAHSNEYSDFRTDGKVYSYLWESNGSSSGNYYYDTANYTINGTKLITSYTGSASPDTFDIQTLTNNSLATYNKYVGSTLTDEEWFFYSK